MSDLSLINKNNLNLQFVQQPNYNININNLLQNILQRLQKSPNICQLEEISDIYSHFMQINAGKKILLNYGECAELFSQMNKKDNDKFITMNQKINEYFSRLDIVTIARLGGQTAKPRSKPYEIRNNVSLPTYRGDIINKIDFNLNARNHDPERLLINYKLAKNVHDYMLENNIFCSHEALHLDYEKSLIRSIDNQVFASSAPFLWIGELTRNLQSAHIEFASHIINPIGVKISSKITADELIKLIEKINPANILGKLTLICRFGCNKIAKKLPNLIQTIQKHKLNIIWMCDPMHGNTKYNKLGQKYRLIEDIKSELKIFFQILQSFNIKQKAIHLEASYDDIYECITNEDVDQNNQKYLSACDPRLNYTQIIDVLTEVL